MLPKLRIDQTLKRMSMWYAGLLIIFVIFGLRLFYLQVIRYSHYHTAALNDQLKQYQIPATRGLIEAHEGSNIVPIVLNQKLYTLYADPTLVKNPSKDAQAISSVLGGSQSNYESLLKTPHTRYVILAKKITKSQSDKILSNKFPGVGTQGQDYRTYPDGSFASQVLGFVNDNGIGEYGIEQALNPQLAGKPGMLKAITDASGVPLVATPGNVDVQPTPGNNVVLTLDMGMQAQMEEILNNEYKKTHSHGLSAIIMDPYTGQIKAMANYPTYNPADYANTNPSLFQNGAVDNAIEPGSIMKLLTTAAALDQGVITPNETFFDPAHWTIDGFTIHDIKQDGGPRQQSISTILELSLNTGATWELMQMSHAGGTTITMKGIKAWRSYMANHYRFGQQTGIEQGYEATGYVPPIDNRPSINLRFANTTFGQGVSTTPIQMAAAISSVLNGGTYYQPTLISEIQNPNGYVKVNHPKVLERNVVSPKVGPEVEQYMKDEVHTLVSEGYSFANFSSNYTVGGKTGTAQLALPTGGYSQTQFNGSYMGLVGGNKPQYIIVVYNIKPNLPSYEFAGASGAAPVFADLAHMLINEGYVSPKS